MSCETNTDNDLNLVVEEAKKVRSIVFLPPKSFNKRSNASILFSLQWINLHSTSLYRQCMEAVWRSVDCN